MMSNALAVTQNLVAGTGNWKYDKQDLLLEALYPNQSISRPTYLNIEYYNINHSINACTVMHTFISGFEEDPVLRNLRTDQIN